MRFREKRPDIVLDVQTSHPVVDDVMTVNVGDLVTIETNPSCEGPTNEFASYWELAVYDENGTWIDGIELDETGPTLTFEATADMDGKFIYGEVYSVNGTADYAWFAYRLNVLPADCSIELSQQLLEMNVGESAALEAVHTPFASAAIQWNSSSPAVVQVNQNGQLQAADAGTAIISATCGEHKTAVCRVVVHSSSALVLPEDLLRVDASSFVNVAAEEIVLPETLLIVCEEAFAGNSQLKLVTIPGVHTVMEQGAFADCPNVTFLCSENSKAMIYAQAEGIPYVVMD